MLLLWKRSWLIGGMAILLALSTVTLGYDDAGGGIARASGAPVTYTQDFSNVVESPGPVWDIDDTWQGNNAQIVGGALTNLEGGLHGLRYKKTTPATGTYTAQFDLVSAPGDTSPWMTLYVGLRLGTYSRQANEPDGLWLAFKDNKIGMRTNNWPETTYMTIDYDFYEARRVFIEDNVDQDIVKIYVQDDQGSKTFVAQVNIQGQSVGMYAADDLATPKITTDLSYQLAKSGYINWWVHITPGVFLDNVSVITEAGTDSVDFPNDTVIRDEIWEVNNARVIDGALTNQNGGLYGLRFKKKTAAAGSYQVKFDLQAAPEDTSPWMTMYVGLRLSSYSSQANESTGLWLAFKDNKVGIRTNNWPLTGYVQIPYSFADKRTIELEDDLDQNIVKIYVNDDQGVKQFVAQVAIDDENVMLYAADNLQTPAVTSQPGYAIGKSGFINWWVHNTPNIVLDNVSVTTAEYERPPYEAAEPFQYRDVYSDTWVATDDLSRTSPDYAVAGAPKDKKVGMFYFLWHDASSGQIYDHNKTYLEGGVNAVWDIIPQGPLGFAHYWAEPYFGYYRSDDRWVIRKHANMLTEAGVDFVFFDNSNNLLYPHIYTVVLDEYKKMRNEGLDTPQIVFFFGDNADSGKNMMTQAWEEVYKDNYYNELWFKVDGKPLVLGNLAKVPKTLREQFTVRSSWAFNGWTGDGMGRWPWIAEYPQAPGKDPATGEVEQLTVASGFHANSSRGRSFANGEQPTDGLNDFEFELQTTPLGLAYEEQWSRVSEVDPEYVMLTGWNEWWAGRWENDANGQRIANTYTVVRNDPLYKHYYVDAFNPEFSRDLEPMKGGFNDNYYYQTVEKIRQFKGVRPVPAAFGQGKIHEHKAFQEWKAVGPEYRDTLGDTVHRDSMSFAGVYRYTNTSGRNDIEYAKVSSDNHNWYFYVRTKDALTARTGTDWMNLYIDADQNAATGWEGYDFIINRSDSGGKAAIEANDGGTWNWTKTGDAEYTVSGNEMYMTIPKNMLSIDAAQGFDFKWADNSVDGGDVMQFLDQGDAAPNGRFNYRYTTRSQNAALSAELTSLLNGGAVAMKVNGYEAYLGDKKVIVDGDNTNVTPIGDNGQLYIPVAFLEKTAKKVVDKKELKKWRGEDYVDVSTAALILGKQATVSESGVVLFSAGGNASGEVLEELFRKL
ncbi:hypothetical protein [Paenibacillus spongiae]|uniref:Uncharacterized protein n=1 Tax=Paenibacillus spongiae TaxID=2909671 RepID=A0ABY5SC07_9BACL|nr:hypothetical protein [Paenibacillus spongiae]UVI31058.1 hypothetical protein L1F29_04165 [Paenibacillus spongiae]